MNQATFTFYWSLTGIFIFVVSRKLNHTCNYLWFFQYPIIQNGILNFFLWRWNSLIYYALYFSSPCAIIKFYWFSVFFVMSNTFNHNKFINQSCIASSLWRISGFSSTAGIPWKSLKGAARPGFQGPTKKILFQAGLRLRYYFIFS